MTYLDKHSKLEQELDEAAQGYSACQHITNLITLEGLKKHVNVALKFLRTFEQEYDSIAFSGLSGALLAPIVAQRMKKHLIAVRKPDDTKAIRPQRITSLLTIWYHLEEQRNE
jgi:hypothetical protein